MSYVIGSFNLLKMDFKSNDETKKNFDRIADIIREEQFDVIALQEVMTEMAVNELIKRLGPMYWDSVFKPSTITASKDAQREGYAFLWKKRRLHLVDAASAVELKDEYRIRRDGSGAFIHQGSLVRPPLVIRLTPQGLLGGSNFELRLINTHIAFNSPVNCADKYNDAVLRRMELKVLAEEVYRKVSSKRYGINIPAYTILMGDYNLCLAGGGTPVVEEIIDITSTRQLRTVQRERTSLKQTSASYSTPDLNMEHDRDVKTENDVDNYSSNYDHFSYEVDLDAKMRLTVSRVEALGKYYGNDLEAYRREVSDHVPIKLIMDLRTR